jgi:hypothetical protein
VLLKSMSTWRSGAGSCCSSLRDGLVSGSREMLSGSCCFSAVVVVVVDDARSVVGVDGGSSYRPGLFGGGDCSGLSLFAAVVVVVAVRLCLGSVLLFRRCHSPSIGRYYSTKNTDFINLLFEIEEIKT